MGTSMKGLDATQVEQLRQIAEYLSYQREQKSISLEKIANQTYIPLRLLRALDSLQLEQLPEPVYIRGFIRRYADALGLDGIEIADAFPVESVVPPPTEADEPGELSQEAQPASYEAARSAARPEPPISSSRPLLLAGVGAVVLIGAIALGIFSALRRPAAPPSPTTAAQSEIPTATAKKPAHSSSSSSTKAGTGTTSLVKAEVSLTDRSWLQVIADGKTAFEGTLDQGEQRTWQARKKLVITAGNAGAVILSCNQGDAKPLGKVGEVVDATCPPAQKTSQTEAQ
ncbi:helix-turn-helix domain-containing protein [Leptodesmis sichuanensis]|uniref:helix-turn-helix domain-containing protein n=1 Tax=Leptodesmis sichuanensis TaxID=2906798 RepID=UPI001F3D51B0|nr:RodZ domain-containing protein [Leptodesmis sichuanensis]UIE39231.1 helix-turn-helix domain-containing protein [Leptodesmis sichuanensis A121]